jgi:hypothetical protein
MIIMSHDYKVVINIHKVIIQHNVKLNNSMCEHHPFLRVSWRFESIINFVRV